MNIQRYIEEFDTQLEQRANNIAASLSSHKPKLIVGKVPEDLRNVKIVIRVPLFNEKGDLVHYLAHPIQWSLNDQHISPKEYISLMSERLKIP